jgi:membrane protein
MTDERHILRKQPFHLREIRNFLADTFQEWSDDNAMTLGAALAFYSAFSLVPLFILINAVFGYFLGAQTAQSEILQRVQQLIGPQGAAVVNMLIKASYQPGAGFWDTFMAIAVILLGSTSAFVMLKQALNIIWGARQHPPSSVVFIIKERLLSFLMITIIGVLLALSFAISVGLGFLTGWSHGSLSVPPFAIRAADFVLSILLITLLFALIYKILPDVKIAWADVWIGAAVNAVLFTIGKILFGLYLGRSSFMSAYGTASSLAVVLLWIYYSSQIFFFGAELTQVYANRYGSRLKPHG